MTIQCPNPDCECKFVIDKEDYNSAWWITCPVCRDMARADEYKAVEE